MRASVLRIPLALAALAFSIAPVGAQWHIQDPHTTADLRGIDSLGNGVAWASGSNGTVLRTEDAGFVWQLCATPPGAEKLDFRGIQAFDNNTAIVMSSGKGDQSRLYKTADGCQSWKLLFTNPEKDGFWDSFVGHKEATYSGSPLSLDGLVLGDPTGGEFEYLAFIDSYASSGPRRQTHQLTLKRDKDETLKADPASAGAFAASNQALVVPPLPKNRPLKKEFQVWPFGIGFVTGGKGGAFLYTTVPQPGDTPESTKWARVALPLGSGSEASGAFAITLLGDRGAGAIVGGDYTKPEETARTAVYFDGGRQSWLPSEAPPGGYRSAVAYDRPHNTWITVGPNGTDTSTDDGRNWHPLKPSATDAPDADQHWNALSLPFVVGPHGRIGLLEPDRLSPAKPTSPK